MGLMTACPFGAAMPRISRRERQASRDAAIRAKYSFLSAMRTSAFISIVCAATFFFPLMGHCAPDVADASEIKIAAVAGSGETVEPGGAIASCIQLLLKKPKMCGHMRDGKPIFTTLTGEFCGGLIIMEGNIDLSQPLGPHRARIHFRNVQIAPVLALLGGSFGNSATARITGVANLHWRGLVSQSVRRTLEGTASVEIFDASLQKSPAMECIAEVGGFDELDRLDITHGKVEAIFQAGKMEILSQAFAGPQFKLASKGNVQLATGELNLNCNLQLDRCLAESSARYRLASLLLPFSKPSEECATANFVSIPQFTVAGTVRKPDVQFEAAANDLLPTKSPIMSDAVFSRSIVSDSDDLRVGQLSVGIAEATR